MQINCLKQRSKVDAPKIFKGIEVISPQVAPDWRCGPSPGLNHDTQLWAEALQTEALQTEPAPESTGEGGGGDEEAPATPFNPFALLGGESSDDSSDETADEGTD